MPYPAFRTKESDLAARTPGGTLFLPVYGIEGTPADGEVPTWDDMNKKLVFGTGGGGASALDDLSDVSIATPAAGDYLRHNGAAWVDATIQTGDLGSGSADSTKFLAGDRTWKALTGAGGAVPDWVLYDPRSIVPGGGNDDEFTAGTLGGAWTESTAGTLTKDYSSTYPSHIYIRLEASNPSWSIRRAAPTGTGTFSATILISAAPFQGNGTHQVLFGAVDSGATNAIYAKWSAGNLYLMSQDSGAFTDRTFSNLGWFTQLFIHIQRYASNVWRIWYSTDGRAWHAVGGSTFTKSFTVDTIRISCGASGATIYGAGLRHALDFYRENWLTL